MKDAIKKLIPKRLLNAMLPAYHIVQAIAANIIYGFPARNLKVIGVTGTNGKTTSIQFITGVLQEAGYKVAALSSVNFVINGKQQANIYNMTTLTPFALQRLLRKINNETVDWVVLEITSHALAQYRTLGVPVHIAVMTNFTEDHLEYHGTMEAYAAAKANLFRKAKGVVVLNRDDEHFEYFAEQSTKPLYTYGLHADSDVLLSRVDTSHKGSHITVRYNGRAIEADVDLLGAFNAQNAMPAVVVGSVLDVNMAAIKRGIEKVHGVPGRMEEVENGLPSKLIVDYAHTPDAMEKALTALRQLENGRVIAVFGGTPTHDYYGLGLAAGRLADVIIVTDDEPMDKAPAAIRDTITKAVSITAHDRPVHNVPGRKKAIKMAYALAGNNDIIAVLGLGSQQYIRISGKRISWSDIKVAKELAATMKLA